MLNNRAGADLAAAGQGHLGHPHAGQQGADAEKAGPQGVDQFVGRGGLGDVVAVEIDDFATPDHPHTKGGQDFAHGSDVGETGDIAQPQSVLGQEAGSHQHEGRILGPIDFYLAAQPLTAGDLEPWLNHGLGGSGEEGHGGGDYRQVLLEVNLDNDPGQRLEGRRWNCLVILTPFGPPARTAMA